MAGASTILGCIPGAMCTGFLSDRFGRKKMLFLCAALFAVSGILSALPRTFEQFLTARFLSGLAIGASSIICPVYIAEIFPNKVRGRAMSVASFTVWASCYIVAQTFPVLNDSPHVGPAITFWIYSGISLLAFLMVLAMVPETKGRSLEEIEEYWRRPSRELDRPRSEPMVPQVLGCQLPWPPFAVTLISTTPCRGTLAE